MELNKGMFDMKIRELNQQYSQMQSHILLCQDGNQDEIRKEIKKIEEECKENDLLLKNRVMNSRSNTVSKLAEAQLEYNKKIEDILSKDSLSCKESAALFAEYAIDFATQTVRHALLAALYAVEVQMIEEDKKNRSDI